MFSFFYVRAGSPGQGNVVLALLFGLVVNCLPSSAHADSAQLSFTGKITSASCSVSTTSQNVTLGNFSSVMFQQSGDMSPITNFAIVANCPAGGPTMASIIFSGAADNTDPTLLAISSGAGSATGIAIRIEDMSGNKIDLGTNSVAMPLVTGNNMFSFAARYQSTGDWSTVEGGTANGTAQFTLNYP